MLLVTGGAGFIGSNIVASLNEAGRTDIVVNDVLGSDGKWRNLAKRQFADFVPPADLIRWLDGQTISALVECETVTGGMLPKLEACTRAKRHGIERVRILPASNVDLLPAVFTQRIDSGTEVLQ